MKVTNYRELIVWQKSIAVAKQVYLLVKKLPKEELYALSDQMRRSAISISSNIAEGQERKTPIEFARFISYAQGSRAELETQLILCLEIGYFTENEINPILSMLEEIGKMLHSISNKLPLTTNHYLCS